MYRETEGFGRYAGWFPVRGAKYTHPYVVAFDECNQFLRVAFDDVYPGLRENNPAWGERDVGITAFMYWGRFFCGGLVLGCSKKRAGIGKSGDAFRSFIGHRAVGDGICHDPVGGCRALSSNRFYDYCCRGFYQHAVANPFR